MKVLLLAWTFFYYDPSLQKHDLTPLTFDSQVECEERRIRKYNDYVVKYGWTAYLNHKGWWVSPACGNVSGNRTLKHQ